MAKCRKCNRVLKREPYASNGIGKICASKDAWEKGRNESDTDEIVPYDGGDVWIERIMTNDGGRLNFSGGLRTNVKRTEYKHSPTGFNFGYAGSGPADLALNILLMIVPDKTFCYNHYQEFKTEFLGIDGKALVIPRADILKFVQEKRQADAVAALQNGGEFYAHGRTLDGENIYPNFKTSNHA